MNRLSSRILLPVTILCAVAAFGFRCSSATTTFTLKRYSSIPPIVRWTIFSGDGKVTILDPPKTDTPFTFTVTNAERDSLEMLCSAYAAFDTLYFPDRPIPNPASMDLEFVRDGVTKSVHISQFPPLPPALQSLLDYAGKIEHAGLALREKAH